MEIVDLAVRPAHFHKAAAQLFVDNFDKSHARPNLSLAYYDVTDGDRPGKAKTA